MADAFKLFWTNDRNASAKRKTHVEAKHEFASDECGTEKSSERSEEGVSQESLISNDPVGQEINIELINEIGFNRIPQDAEADFSPSTPKSNGQTRYISKSFFIIN